jgi:subtilisin family serine protease
LDGDFIHDRQWGENVTAYIVDSGIYVQHKEFIGRAFYGFTAYPNETNGLRASWWKKLCLESVFLTLVFSAADCNGHGTHVAGTVGGTNAGVARNVTLISVKVMDCKGKGTLAAIIGGLKWTADDWLRRRGKAVISSFICLENVISDP